MGRASSCLQVQFMVGGDPVPGATGSIRLSVACPAIDNYTPTFAMCPNSDDCSACTETTGGTQAAFAKMTEITNIVASGPAKCVDYSAT